jgi:hypothetical protein
VGKDRIRALACLSAKQLVLLTMQEGSKEGEGKREGQQEWGWLLSTKKATVQTQRHDHRGPAGAGPNRWMELCDSSHGNWRSCQELPLSPSLVIVEVEGDMQESGNGSARRTRIRVRPPETELPIPPVCSSSWAVCLTPLTTSVMVGSGN